MLDQDCSVGSNRWSSASKEEVRLQESSASKKKSASRRSPPRRAFSFTTSKLRSRKATPLKKLPVNRASKSACLPATKILCQESNRRTVNKQVCLSVCIKATLLKEQAVNWDQASLLVCQQHTYSTEEATDKLHSSKSVCPSVR